MRFTSPEELRQALEKEGYFLDEDLAGVFWTALQIKPVGGAILGGPPGVGKSSLPAALAKALKCPLVSFQVFPGMPDETLLVRHTVDEKGNVVASEGFLVEVARLSLEYPLVVALLNEMDKARVSADTMLLDFLQTGEINYLGRKIKADLSRVLFFITTNDMRPLLEALTRRLPRIDIPPMRPELLARLLGRDGFSDKEIGLGIKLYLAGFEANLSRPITYQELSQFLTALRLNPQAKLVDYLRVYLIKDGEIDNYLYALKNLPEKVVLEEEQDSREQEVREAVKSPLLVQRADADKEEPQEAPLEYPEVIINLEKRRRPEVKVRVLNRKEVELKTGYFKANDYIYDVLNRSGVEFSAVEIQGQKYVFLKKPMDAASVENFLINAKEHKGKIEGAFLYVQDLYINWERFRKEFDFKEYLSSYHSVKPLLLYRGEKAVRVDFRKEDNSIADVLFYERKGRAIMEVHIEDVDHTLVLERGASLFLLREVEKWKKEEERQKREAERQKQESQPQNSEEKRSLTIQEVLLALGARKEEVNGKPLFVIPTEEYAVDEDCYKPIYDDILIETNLENTVLFGAEDVRINVRVYFPTFLYDRDDTRFPMRNAEGKEIISDRNVYSTGKYAEKPGYSKRQRHYGGLSIDVRDDLKLSLTEHNVSKAVEVAVERAMKRFALPLLEYLKERQQIRKVKESIESRQEEILLNRGKSVKACRM